MIKLYSLITDLIQLILKYFKHVITGKCEIERICGGNEWHTKKMTLDFLISLNKSKQLASFKKSIFVHNLFPVSSFLEGILSVKKIPRSKHLVVANISHCLHSLRYVNQVIKCLENARKVAFDKNKTEDVKLLNSFWDAMKPHLRRSKSEATNSIESSDWGEVGFQGKDPSTDFRGMGMLGLQQLVYFGKNRSNDAQKILLDSNHPRRFYPFAATGINISSFVMELLSENRLHLRLFTVLEQSMAAYKYDTHEGPASSHDLVELGCAAVNEVFCDVYSEFNALWVQRDPPNIMAFQTIFTEIKLSFRSKMHAF